MVLRIAAYVAVIAALIWAIGELADGPPADPSAAEDPSSEAGPAAPPPEDDAPGEREAPRPQPAPEPSPKEPPRTKGGLLGIPLG